MKRGATIAAAFALDLLLGDPDGFPHPVRLFGTLIVAGEPAARRAFGPGRSSERAAGSFLASSIVAGAALLSTMLLRGTARFTSKPTCTALATLLAASTLATRDLVGEADAVLDALEGGDIVYARARLARIVGRDTERLDCSEIVRATIETLAESASDGIVAPLVALAVGSVPGALAFKAASTLDSMIGHIEAPYTDFGRFAAKLDDALCFFPARFCAALVCVSAPVVRGSPELAWRTLRTDGAKHASPNAGRPEAAMAGALGVRLGGTNRYDGIERRGAFLGEALRPPELEDGRRARNLVLAVACAAAVCCAVGSAVLEGS